MSSGNPANGHGAASVGGGGGGGQTPGSNSGQNAPAEPTQVTSMPLPPMQYIKAYEETPLAAPPFGRSAASQAAAGGKRAFPSPPPPITDAYTMFGAPFSADDTIIQTLESQGIRRLYSLKDFDRKRELHKFNHSILMNFLDLIDILIKSPDSMKREEKIEDCNMLFIHMHHLINEFRPHQARETLRVMLHVQKRKRMQVAQKFQANLDKVQQTIEDALQSLPETDEDNKLLLNLDATSAMDTSSSSSDQKQSCSSTDRLMCQLADQISHADMS